MRNQVADLARRGFNQSLEWMGTLCDVGGEQRKATKGKKSGRTIFGFPEEFPLKRGDRVREIATESYFTVVDMEPVSAGGEFVYFRVTTERII
jgi:hypothetical protein